MPNSHPDNTQELEPILTDYLFASAKVENQMEAWAVNETTMAKLKTLITQSNLKAVEAFAADIERLIAARQSADGQTISVNLLRRAIGRYIKENKD